jgi:hypothetical protein
MLGADCVTGSGVWGTWKIRNIAKGKKYPKLASGGSREYGSDDGDHEISSSVLMHVVQLNLLHKSRSEDVENIDRSQFLDYRYVQDTVPCEKVGLLVRGLPDGPTL